MSDVNAPRQYSSPLREQQAANTRRAVLSAAAECFLEHGYGATTIEQVASRAGVSKPTVFTAVGNKQALLQAVRDVAIAGDDEPVPIVQRPRTIRVQDEPDRHKAIRLLARDFTNVHSRYAPINEVIRGAAAGGEENLRQLWATEEQQRLTGARHWVKVLVDKAPLRPGLDQATAVDMMWLFMASDNYTRLVHGRGWTKGKYQRWLAESIETLFA